MLECRINVFIFVAASLLGSCAAVGPDDSSANTEEKGSELIAIRRCQQDSDCPVPASACQECSDGNFSCPAAVCNAGRCGVSFPTCPEPELIFCGGIAGFQCPSGLECVDDPRDDCSPCRGGADCGGICVELSCK